MIEVFGKAFEGRAIADHNSDVPQDWRSTGELMIDDGINDPLSYHSSILSKQYITTNGWEGNRIKHHALLSAFSRTLFTICSINIQQSVDEYFPALAGPTA